MNVIKRHSAFPVFNLRLRIVQHPNLTLQRRLVIELMDFKPNGI